MTIAAAKIVRTLIDLGAIDAEAVVSGDLLIADSTRRHRNFRVMRRAGAGCFVKQVQPGHALADQSLHREAMCYWLVAHDARFAGLRPLLPGFRAYDGARRTLVLELLPESENLSEHHERLGRFPVEVGELLGATLGRAHAQVQVPPPQTPGLEVFPHAVPWILSVHTLAAAHFERLSAANAQILAIVRQYPEFQAALDALRARWTVDGLMHGDMKWDNCLVHPDAARPGGLALRIVDWELADFGDVGWDVGAIFQSYLGAWILSMPVHEPASADALVDRAARPIESMQPAIGAFWRRYLEVRGAGGARAGELLVRCVQYAAARMIQTAYEHMTYAPSLSAGSLRLLQVSVNILTRPHDAIRGLLGLGDAL
jgi:Ser/Thr protein kinase RdoA (MazF antagonist)